MTPENENAQGLRQIAFVAMPFGTKPTGLRPGQQPSQVDFDALWSRAIKPALENLNYYPVRADEQSGTVIIKDMLAQLVHADLVLADISLANGNVYYEAGIRHAAKERGCVLIMASWAKVLFDLKQITQLRYKLNADCPVDLDYKNIQIQLEKEIPHHINSTGPVYELVNSQNPNESTSNQLREQAASLFEFDHRLKEAVLQADSKSSGDRHKLRSLIEDGSSTQLPVYALKDLVIAARDNLNWGELLNFLNRLPESVRNLGWIIEQKALAESKLGNLSGAIARLENLVQRDGPTSDLYGNIGSRYRDLARLEGSNQQSLNKAIDAYEMGLQYDLNDYYCSHKLLVSYLQRGRPSDRERAAQCAIHVHLACQRAECINPDDEWLAPAKLIIAVYNNDLANSELLIYSILDRGWTNWKLVGLLTDLKSLFKIDIEDSIKSSIDNEPDEDKKRLLQMIKKIEDELPVSQEALKVTLLEELLTTGGLYKKVESVHARLAREGEVIVSITKGGEEGQNVAKAGDIVVRNQTEAKEEYIVKSEKFRDRYKVASEPQDEWQLYEPVGEARAIEITHAITTRLQVGNRFFIEAPWGESQFASEGDYFVSPSPQFDEIYRVGKPEFEKTYALK